MVSKTELRRLEVGSTRHSRLAVAVEGQGKPLCVAPVELRRSLSGRELHPRVPPPPRSQRGLLADAIEIWLVPLLDVPSSTCHHSRPRLFDRDVGNPVDNRWEAALSPCRLPPPERLPTNWARSRLASVRRPAPGLVPVKSGSAECARASRFANRQAASRRPVEVPATPHLS